MRLLLFVALLGCATHPSLVRDPEGRPLPTTARIDADLEPAPLRCGARQYQIVEPPPPYLSGNHLATHTIHIEDPVALCAKIRALD